MSNKKNIEFLKLAQQVLTASLVLEIIKSKNPNSTKIWRCVKGIQFLQKIIETQTKKVKK